MIAIDGVEMPKNCYECDSFGISDLVGIKCPCLLAEDQYSFTRRPDGCPIKETISVDELTLRLLSY